MSHVIGLINRHTIYQCNELSQFNDMDWGFENGDVIGGHCFMNSHTISESNNHNYIDTTKKMDGNVPNIYEMADTGLQDSIEIYVMLPVSKLHQYSNMG